HSPEQPPLQSDVDAEEDCDGGPDNDGHSGKSYERVDTCHDEMDTPADIGHKAHLGEPRRPFLPSQEEEPAGDIEGADGGAFVGEDGAVSRGDAKAVAKEEARYHLRHAEEDHQRGDEADSPRPTLSRFHTSRTSLPPNVAISGVAKWRGPCVSNGRDTSLRPSASHCYTALLRFPNVLFRPTPVTPVVSR